MKKMIALAALIVGLNSVIANNEVKLKGKFKLLENIKGECPEELEVNTYITTIHVGYKKAKGDIPVYAFNYSMERINEGTKRDTAFCLFPAPEVYYNGPCFFSRKTDTSNKNKTITHLKGINYTNADAYYTSLTVKVEEQTILFKEKQYNLPLLMTAFNATPLSIAVGYYEKWPIAKVKEDMECRYDLATP